MMFQVMITIWDSMGYYILSAKNVNVGVYMKTNTNMVIKYVAFVRKMQKKPEKYKYYYFITPHDTEFVHVISIMINLYDIDGEHVKELLFNFKHKFERYMPESKDLVALNKTVDVITYNELSKKYGKLTKIN